MSMAAFHITRTMEAEIHLVPLRNKLRIIASAQSKLFILFIMTKKANKNYTFSFLFP